MLILKFKILWLFFIFFTLTYAEDMQKSIHVSSMTPYEREGVILDVNLTQLDHSKMMLFTFTLQRSNAYSFKQVDFQEENIHHDLKQKYRYLIYPKKSGEVALKFKLIKSITTDDKVTYAISGDRDSVKSLEKEDIVVSLKPLILNVKPLPKGTDIVGSFTLTQTLDRDEVDAFEPVNLKVELKGEGYLDRFELYKKSNSYHLFTQPPKLKSIYSKKGTISNLKWDYAISANSSFTLSKVTLKGFDPKTQKSYELVIPAYSVKVNSVAKDEIVDKENLPPLSSSIDWSWWRWIGSYLMVFLAGYLMPKEWFKKPNKKIEEVESIEDRILKTKTHKELLKLLVLENNSNYKEAIELLEGVVYSKKRVSLSTIKEKCCKVKY